MRRLAWMGLGLVVALVAFTAVATPGARAHGTNSMTYTDPAADAPGAPDMTAVALSDSAHGPVQVAVTVTDMKPLSTITVALDTDHNAATVPDYALEYAIGDDGEFWDIFRWNGSDFVEFATPSSLTFSRSGSTYTFTIDRADLGDPETITLCAAAITWDAGGNALAADRAPDSGNWVYELTPATTATSTTTTTTTASAHDRPWIGKPVSVPARAVAGHHLAVSFPVTREDTGEPLMKGRMVCDPSVAGKVIAHTESFKDGNAHLAFTVPKTAKGKLLTVRLTIRLGSESASKVVTFRVG